MGRWEPNARGRLEQAAMELYRERGFEQTTAAQIASRAGLTERTFFRHYADKREVLFAGAALLEGLFEETLAGVPAAATPMEAMAATLAGVAEAFAGRWEFARQRQGIILANEELRERELIKLAGISARLAEGLRRRGVAEPAASLAGEAGVAVFKVGFERWVGAPGGDGVPGEEGERPLGGFLSEALRELKVVVGAGPSGVVRSVG